MSRKSVQRFCDNGMRKNKDLKRIWRIATRFRYAVYMIMQVWKCKKKALGATFLTAQSLDAFRRFVDTGAERGSVTL
ncbi:hypothetical protein QO002_003790 [Pararhizobium capsulatum DSM 1112]|uniref:Transposase n=1 Tax=Pararhizobium capsulatum DSM 1112 TaxID=1121113 RepID=A0ABU0BXT2_9HYPH|nr:hypothetical protein [Pararhizobium capsulatum DSM 1112]